jgi:S-DNA-T family DNA segregation ATPase FtsK/SpoIIIE
VNSRAASSFEPSATETEDEPEGQRISVTEVRNALRCPRLFALGRALRQQLAFPVGSSCLGAAFHRIVERFAREVDAPAPSFAALPSGAPRDVSEAELAKWLIGFLLTELESDQTYLSIPSEVDDLAEALREFARHLSGRLQRFDLPPAQALTKLLREGERSIAARLEAGGPLLHGRWDALYGDHKDALEIVEYKLTDEANDDLDRAQVALYSALLKAEDGISARPVVLRFTPNLRETTLSTEASELLLEKTLLPVVRSMAQWAGSPELAPATSRKDLCAACPVATQCAETYPEKLSVRDDPPTAGSRPRAGARVGIQDAQPSPAPARAEDDVEGVREADALKDRILSELKRLGTVAMCPRPAIVGPTLYIIEVVRARGPVSQLDRSAEDVRHRLAAEEGIEVEYQREGGHRRFIAKRKQPRKVLLGPLLDKKRDWLSQRAGRFIVGQEPNGEILCADLSDSSTPHLLIAGQSGSGKSVLIQALVASLVRFHGPDAIRFTLIDPKRVTFVGAAFRAAVAAHLEGPIRYEIEEVLPVVEQLVELMEERYRLFSSAQVIDIDEYNEQSSAPERLERRVLVVDEFQDLVIDKQAAAEFFSGIRRLGAKARAAGIHLVLATQRPDRDTVPPIVKANLTGRIALAVSSQVNSRIVLDQGGAERLLGKGDLLATLGRGVVRAQGALLA